MTIPNRRLFYRLSLFHRVRLPRMGLTFALAALISAGAPGRARAGITDAVKTETLPNGLKVLVLENHKAPVATFNLFTRVGSRNESFGKTGISHLVELEVSRDQKIRPRTILQHHPGEWRDG
jgi:hypothetical protein